MIQTILREAASEEPRAMLELLAFQKSSRSKGNKKKDRSSSPKKQKDVDIEKGSLVEDDPNYAPQTDGLYQATTEEVAALPTSLRAGRRLQIESTPGAQRVGEKMDQTA
jgi:hypothetical protein